MYDGGKIIIGLLIFLFLLSFPVWYNVAKGKATYQPDPKIITSEKQCVAATDYMTTEHMVLLDSWRDDVVRKDHRAYDSEFGKVYEMSLSNTCMDCHSNKSEFCDECHNYMGVDPYCWNCHIAPEEGEK